MQSASTLSCTFGDKEGHALTAQYYHLPVNPCSQLFENYRILYESYSLRLQTNWWSYFNGKVIKFSRPYRTLGNFERTIYHEISQLRIQLIHHTCKQTRGIQHAGSSIDLANNEPCMNACVAWFKIVDRQNLELQKIALQKVFIENLLTFVTG